MGLEITFTTMDDYIAQFSPDIRERLQAVRETIRSAAPDASEKISWGMPTFFLNGNLVHFAAAKKHIGFYPGADGIELFKSRFEEERLSYSKGAVQFPHTRPLPLELVVEITRFRASQNREVPRKKEKTPPRASDE